MDSPIVIIGEVVLVPVLTFVTMWVRNLNAKDIRRDNRDDNYIKALSDRIDTCEKRHSDRDREMSEIRVELKTRDVEYAKLYQEHATIRAKYEVLVSEHDMLRKEYDATATELAALKEAIKKDRVLTSDLAAHTASNMNQ
jgi:chromosome segregation ATPase